MIVILEIDVILKLQKPKAINNLANLTEDLMSGPRLLHYYKL